MPVQFFDKPTDNTNIANPIPPKIGLFTALGRALTNTSEGLHGRPITQYNDLEQQNPFQKAFADYQAQQQVMAYLQSQQGEQIGQQTVGGQGIQQRQVQNIPNAPKINRISGSLDNGVPDGFQDFIGTNKIPEDKFVTTIEGGKIKREQTSQSKSEQDLSKQLISKQQKEADDQLMNFRKTTAGMSLYAQSYADAVSRGQDVLRSVGLDINPSKGLEGKIFAKLNSVSNSLGYNPIFKSIEEGMALEIAPEIAKSQGGGIRLGQQIIEAYRKTLPKLGDDTTAQGAEQLINTAANSFRKYAATARDEQTGEFIYPSVDSLDIAVKNFKSEWKDRTYREFINTGIYIPEFRKFTVDGKNYDIPDYLVEDFKREKGIK